MLIRNTKLCIYVVILKIKKLKNNNDKNHKFFCGFGMTYVKKKYFQKRKYLLFERMNFY